MKESKEIEDQRIADWVIADREIAD